ncbi:MAG: sulfite exporter TauE/SafE family protein [Actinomycetes bacterium]
MLILEFLTAIAAGVLAGLTGGGGGMFFVPVLIFAGMPVVEALATSNLGILITSASGTLTNVRQGLVPWRRVLWLGIPAIVLAPLGAWIAFHLPGDLLILGFILLNLTNIVLTARKPAVDEYANTGRTPTPLQYTATGGSGGLLAGLFGIGGGLIVVPLQILWLSTPIKIAARASLAVIMLSSAAAVLGHSVVDGGIHWRTGIVLGIGGVIGAPIGALLLRRISPTAATRILQLVLLGVSITLTWQLIA